MKYSLAPPYTASFDPAPFGYQQLDGLKSGSLDFGLFRLLTGITSQIDLVGKYYNPENRDWTSDVKGSHWTLDSVSPLSEVGVSQCQLTSGDFLLHASGHLKYIDERNAGDAFYSGLRFDTDVRFSQRIMQVNRDYLESGGFDCFLRKRRDALSGKNVTSTVVGVFPWAFPKLKLIGLQGYGQPPSNPTLILPDGTRAESQAFLQNAYVVRR